MTNTDSRLRPALTRATIFFAIAIALTAAAVRLPKLSVFLTPDETRWACRSTNFYNALATGDFAATYQKEHPGVITMWLGGLGQAVDPKADWAVACRDINPSNLVSDAPRPALDEITQRLYRGRIRIALFVSLCIGLMVWLLGRLFNHRVALLAGLLIALDPFYVAHSRVLHVDGVTATLMTLSLLWLLLWLHRGKRRRDLLLSGAMAGLAAVNKSPALFMAPVAGLLMAADALAARRPRTVREALGAVGPLARDVFVLMAAWGGAAIAAYVVVWPAMWVHPFGSLRNVLGGAESYAQEGHDGGNYFWGRPVPDPGPAFYPVAWALRTTPVAMLGLVLAAWFGFARRRPNALNDEPIGARGAQQAAPLPNAKHLPAAPPHANDLPPTSESAPAHESLAHDVGEGPLSPVQGESRVRAAANTTPIAHLLTFAFLFTVVMTGGAKKFDRYLLPIFPALNIVAAWGIATALVAWGERGMRRREAGDPSAPAISSSSATPPSAASPVDATMAAIQAEGAIAVGALVVAWWLAFTLYAHRPYFLDYYNPLAGGPRAGEFALLLGWGEGLDQAATYLNAQLSPETLQLATRYRSVIGPQFKGLSQGMDDIDPAVTDYFVFYRNQLQRILDPELIGRYFGPDARPDHAPTPIVPPDLTMTVGGLTYGWVFANRNWEPAARFIDERADASTDAILVRAQSGFARGYKGPLPVLEVDPNAPDAAVDAQLADAFRAHQRLWWVRYDDVVPFPALRRVDDALALAGYRTADRAYDELRASRFDRAEDTAGVLRGASTAGAGVTSAAVSATVALTEPIAYFDRDPAEPVVGIALTSVDVPARPGEPGRGLAVTLHWARPAFAADYVAFIHLVSAADADGLAPRRIAQDDRQLIDASGQPTSRWPVGSEVADRRVVPIPAGTLPGPYTLLIGVYDAATGRRLSAAARAPGDGTPLKDAQRLTDDVYRWPIEIGRSPVAFDDSALGLTNAAVDAPMTASATLHGFEAARPVDAGGTASIATVWRAGDDVAGAVDAEGRTAAGGGLSGDASAVAPVTATLPAFVHIRVTDTLGANVGDIVAPFQGPPPSEWRATDRLKQTFDVPLYGRALAGEGFIRFEWLAADKRILPGAGPDGRAAVTAPFTIDGPLRVYDLPADVPSDAKRDTVFGDVAKLRAAEVAATRVDAGMPLTVTLWWEALAQHDEGHLVDIGFLADDGHVLASSAGGPADFHRWTNSWITGEIVRDRHVLVPEAEHRGRLTLAVRLTAADGGAPVVAAGEGAGLPEGWVKLATVTVR